MFSLYFQPFVILISSRVGFEGWIGVLIASVPDLCMLFTFKCNSFSYCSVNRKQTR